MRVQETWDSFWGMLMLRRFHLENPQRWLAREAKADWLLSHLAVQPDAHLVDLGCGDGVLAICLARRRYRVTAIDRIATVLEAAREEAASAPVEFVAADLCGYDFDKQCFAGAIWLDGFGLMGREDEFDLCRRLRRALSPGGPLILDWPPRASAAAWERPFDDGVLKVSADYDEANRVQTTLLEFHRPDGRVIELYDPLGRADYRGVRRYLYPLEEAQGLLCETGYESHLVAHYRAGSGYHSLLAVAG